MYRALFAGIFLMGSLATMAQEATPKVSPGTRVEAFSTRAGSLIISGFTPVGGMGGEQSGRVSIQARELRDAANPKSALWSVYLIVSEPGRPARVGVAHVDEDEIDSLLRALDYLAKLTPTSTGMKHVDGSFTTKGGLSISVMGQDSLSISAGRGIPAMVVFRIEEIDRLRQYIVDAKALIDAAKQRR